MHDPHSGTVWRGMARQRHHVLRYMKEQVDFLDTAGFKYVLGPPGAILGRTARQQFQKCGQEQTGLNTSASAPFAAAMAMKGLDLALTRRSYMVDKGDVRYLRIGM